MHLAVRRPTFFGAPVDRDWYGLDRLVMIGGVSETRDYQDWHRRYNDPSSGMSWRLERVRQHIGDALDGYRSAIRVLSVCAGDGRDLLGVTAGDLNDEVRARFAAAGFSEVIYETHDSSGLPALGVVRYQGPPAELQHDGSPLFTFLR